MAKVAVTLYKIEEPQAGTAGIKLVEVQGYETAKRITVPTSYGGETYLQTVGSWSEFGSKSIRFQHTDERSDRWLHFKGLSRTPERAIELARGRWERTRKTAQEQLARAERAITRMEEIEREFNCPTEPEGKR